MELGEKIRKYRIAGNMTQEEMAYRLGVTTPAVNKWENGKTFPDISLLAPIARLLNTDVDTLLSFRETLTDEERDGYERELEKQLKQGSYAEGFAYGKSLIEKYPNCDKLKWQIASLLDAYAVIRNVSEEDPYKEHIQKWLVSLLDSEEEKIRVQAANALFVHYVKTGEYDRAEEMLGYDAEENPERKRKQAELCWKRGRQEEACKLYEELLFSGYQMCSMVLHSLCSLSLQDQDLESADYYLDKQEDLAKLFEMGKYHEICGRMDVVAAGGDSKEIEKMAAELMGCVDTVTAFKDAPLYRHMKFKEIRQDTVEEMKSEMLQKFQNEGYMP